MEEGSQQLESTRSFWMETAILPDLPAGIVNETGTLIRDETEMKTEKGKLYFKNLRKYFLIWSCLPLLFAGCVHWPDIAYDCESYGVREDNQPMGTMLPIEALYRDELDVSCAGVDEPLAMIDQGIQVSGCVVPQQNGTVAAYYWVGDRCAMNHELCHVKHGRGHTERYERDLKNGVPRPFCPVNQLSFKG